MAIQLWVAPFWKDRALCAHTQKWSGRRDSNPRHPAWEAGVLPLNYSRSLTMSILHPLAELVKLLRNFAVLQEEKIQTFTFCHPPRRKNRAVSKPETIIDAAIAHHAPCVP